MPLIYAVQSPCRRLYRWETIILQGVIYVGKGEIMDSESWKCPCMPQCPNYGKCRECIAAHAKFYTAPKCIKIMQEEMKKNHLHPSNPHIKKTLAERVKEYYEQHPDTHLRTAAEELKITEWQLLDAMETAISIPKEDFKEIYNQLKTLDSIMLHLDTGGVLMQITMPLPDIVGRQGVDIVSRKSEEISITSLIFEKEIYALFLVREIVCGGKESLSLAIVGEDEKISLSIYLRRTAEGIIQSSAKELFEALWTKYNTEQENNL